MGSFDKYIKWNLQIFDPVVCVYIAAIANGCQLEKLTPCRNKFTLKKNHGKQKNITMTPIHNHEKQLFL